MKNKILSLALACFIIASVFALAIPTAAETAVFSVADKDGTPIGSYTAYNAALKAAFDVGGGTIEMLSDHTITASCYADSDIATRTQIVINGNGHTLKTTGNANQLFTFTGGDSITVNDLEAVVDGGTRFTDIYGGTTLTFNDVTFTTNSAIDDQYGHFRTPNVTDNADKVNTLNFNDCSITLNGKGSVIGTRHLVHILDVNMDRCTVKGNTPSKGQYGGFIRNARTVNLNDTNVNVEDRAFWDLKGGDTVRITGNSTVRVRKWAKPIISVLNDYDFILGDNVKLIGKTFAEAKGTANFLNIYAYNPDFYYTDPETAYPYFTAPVMNVGGTLRVSTSAPSYGLRFTSTCAKPTMDDPETQDIESLVNHVIEYGTVITKDTYLEKGLWAEGVQGKATEAATGIFLSAKANNGLSTDATGNVTMNTVLANIKDENLESTFYARSYAAYSLDRLKLINVYVFSRLNPATYGASYKQTVNKTLAENVKDAAEAGYTTEVDSYVSLGSSGYAWTAGKKYTCYSKEQYDALKAIATK